MTAPSPLTYLARPDRVPSRPGAPTTRRPRRRVSARPLRVASTPCPAC